jgi:anti-sigma factor RsiW
MNCEVAIDYLGPYFDGELDVNSTLQVRIHLSSCESCSASLRRLHLQRDLIREANLIYEPPPELEARIRKTLQRDRRRSPQWLSFDWRSWGMVAASLLLAGTLSIRTLEYRSRAQANLSDEIISTHVHAMLTGHSSDVLSTDRHTVKPWFNSRIDFSPPVKDLADKGFPLVGGRVDYLAGRTVAALVYQRRKHVIDLYVWPAASDAHSGNGSAKGYSVLRWDSSGMSFAAVSDVSAAELEQFRDTFRNN